MLRGWRKGLFETYLLKKQIRKNLETRALRSAAKPMTIEEIHALHENGVLTRAIFKKNIAYIFPVILELRAEGLSFAKIEKKLGFKRNHLRWFLTYYTKLRAEANKAKALKTDKHA